LSNCCVEATAGSAEHFAKRPASPAPGRSVSSLGPHHRAHHSRSTTSARR